MSPEEKRLLEEALLLSRENNKILKKMRRGQLIGNILGSLKWIILIIVTIWSWFLVQPYFEKMLQMYTQVQEASNSVNNLKLNVDSAMDVSGLQKLIETFRIGNQSTE